MYELHQFGQTVQKAFMVNIRFLSNKLTSRFKGSQFCF